MPMQTNFTATAGDHISFQLFNIGDDLSFYALCIIPAFIHLSTNIHYLLQELTWRYVHYNSSFHVHNILFYIKIKDPVQSSAVNHN
jgi:hypothetical protein